MSNPNGFYVHLAKDLVKATIERARKTAHRTEATTEPPRDSNDRCTVCVGSGRVKGAYCECRMGRDLAGVERRKAKSETKAARKGAA